MKDASERFFLALQEPENVQVLSFLTLLEGRRPSLPWNDDLENFPLNDLLIQLYCNQMYKQSIDRFVPLQLSSFRVIIDPGWDITPVVAEIPGNGEIDDNERYEPTKNSFDNDISDNEYLLAGH